MTPVRCVGATERLRRRTCRRFAAALVVASGVACSAEEGQSQPDRGPPPATILVTLGRLELAVGDTSQPIITAWDEFGAMLPQAPAVTITSDNGTVLTVSGGHVVGSGAGAAHVVATAGPMRGEVLVRVTATRPTRAPADSSIPLQLVRFAPGRDTILVSNGIPLPQGALRPGESNRLHLLVKGVEQRVYVEELAGRHSDGSLRSVLVQFRYPLSGSVGGEVLIGEPRRAGDLARPVADRTLLTAAALPRDPDYLVATEIAGPTITARAGRALGGPFARYENDFAQWAEHHWKLDGSNWSGANYYDRALIYYAFWLRTANPEYFRRAALIAVDYRTRYLEANDYNTSNYWAQMEGLEQHYLLTGDEKSRTAVARVAEVYPPLIPQLDDFNVPWLENRMQARVLQGLFLAWRLNAVGPRRLRLARLLDESIDRVLGTQRADGSYGFASTCRQSLNYMTGLVNDIFIRLYTHYRADPRLVESIRKSTDYLWSTQWIPGRRAFQYMGAECTVGTTLVGGRVPSPDLNNLMVTGYAWLYRHTGDPVYRSRADQIFLGGVEGAYLYGSKQFNEHHTASFRYLGYRRR
jgi:hypothetical protein